MKREDKELLFKDLCGRLPYGIVINVGDKDLKLDRKHQGIGVLYPEDCSDEFNERNNNASFYITISGCYYGEEIKPYLRPMSSMTEDERKDLEKCTYNSFSYNPGDVEIRNMQYQAHDGNSFNPLFKGIFNVPISNCICTRLIDWLNAHHFDYRGLIEKGLALIAPEGMYK